MHPGRGRTGERFASHSQRACLAGSTEERYSRKPLGRDSTEMQRAQAKG